MHELILQRHSLVSAKFHPTNVILVPSLVIVVRLKTKRIKRVLIRLSFAIPSFAVYPSTSALVFKISLAEEISFGERLASPAFTKPYASYVHTISPSSLSVTGCIHHTLAFHDYLHSTIHSPFTRHRTPSCHVVQVFTNMGGNPSFLPAPLFSCSERPGSVGS